MLAIAVIVVAVFRVVVIVVVGIVVVGIVVAVDVVVDEDTIIAPFGAIDGIFIYYLLKIKFYVCQVSAFHFLKNFGQTNFSKNDIFKNC